MNAEEIIAEAAYVWTLAGNKDQLIAFATDCLEDEQAVEPIQDGAEFYLLLYGYEDLTLDQYEVLEMLGLQYHRDDLTALAA